MQADYQNSLQFKPEQDKSLCQCGYRKAALVLYRNGSSSDFHFYRQDSNMAWSHKPGSGIVKDFDASKNKIFDPATANRDYSNDPSILNNYSTFCSYICIPNSVNKQELGLEAQSQ